MDKFRTLIIIAMAVVGYLLILQWNEDYDSVRQNETIAADQDKGPSLINDAAPISQRKGLESAPGDTFDDLAVPEQLQSGADSGVLAQPEPGETGQIITIQTDVLDLEVDLAKGRLINARLLEYPVSLERKEPLHLLSNSADGFFVTETSLVGRDGPDAQGSGQRVQYSAEKSRWRMADGEDTLIVPLERKVGDVRYIKRFVFKRGHYLIQVENQIINNSDKVWRGNLAGKIIRDTSPDPTSSGGFGAVSFLGAVLSTPEDPYQKFSFDDILEDPAQTTSRTGWIAFNQHYFLTAWLPDGDRLKTFQTKARAGNVLAGYVEETVEIPAGETLQLNAALYLGPKIMELLQDAAPNLELTVDFGWLWLIAKPLFHILEFIHDFVGNWGLAIILLTVLIKAVFFRLSAASYRSMAKMRKVAPELTRLRESYGDDRQRMSEAMMNLYKKEKINPLGGCLPILVQMPVFIALYWVLLESVELRQAPFFGWIEDLSIKDPYFILPLLMGVSMYAQMKLNPTPPDPVQARVMQLMPVVFTVFFLWFPSGLVLYWLVNNLLSIAQQWVITKNIEGENRSTSTA